MKHEGRRSPLLKYFPTVQMNREKEEKERSEEDSEGMEESAQSQDGARARE